jgi:hypothetical protein
VELCGRLLVDGMLVAKGNDLVIKAVEAALLLGYDLELERHLAVGAAPASVTAAMIRRDRVYHMSICPVARQQLVDEKSLLDAIGC